MLYARPQLPLRASGPEGVFSLPGPVLLWHVLTRGRAEAIPVYFPLYCNMNSQVQFSPAAAQRHQRDRRRLAASLLTALHGIDAPRKIISVKSRFDKSNPCRCCFGLRAKHPPVFAGSLGNRERDT